MSRRNSTELFAKMEDSPYEAAHLDLHVCGKRLSGILDISSKKRPFFGKNRRI
jgi:hypothetical protein